MKTKIKWIKLGQIHEPLKRTFVTALHQVTEIAAISVEIGLENGLIGHGAATPNEKVTGDTLNSLADIMEKVIKPQLIGQEITDWENLLRLVQNSVRYNAPAKAAFEIALYDLRAQLFQTSLTGLLGGTPHFLTTDYTISIAAEEKMIQEAKQLVQAGFTTLKLKLGGRPVIKDIQLVKKIAETIPKAVSLRIDLNQAWSAKQALWAISEWIKSGLNIEFIEQPVRFDDLAGMKLVTANSPLPIMADESVQTVKGAWKLIDLHACDLINIKLMKTGGLSQAIQISQLCQQVGMKCMIGCMVEARASIAAAVAFATARPNVVYFDLDSVFMSAESQSAGGFTSHKNQLLATSKVGLGL